MNKLVLTLAVLGAAAGRPALAETGGGWVAKVDTRPVLEVGPVGYGLVPRQFSRHDAYFSYRGGGVSLRNGRVRFDYDRSYPYDFAPLPPALEPDGYEAEPREAWCEAAPVLDGRGRDTTVRICRN